MATGGGGAPERTCLCGTVSGSSSCSSTSQQHTSQKSCAKCKICRTKPTKFNFLRGQRSLDLGQQVPASAGSSNGQTVLSPTSHHTSQKTCKETEAARSGRLQQGRRARSAERYEGLRIQDRTLPAVPRQTSLASPGSDGPPEYAYPDLPTMSSPPPTYEVAMSKISHPPTYEEYLKERLKQQQLSTPPPLPPRNPNMPSRSNPSPPPPWSQHSASTTTTSITTASNFCSCSKCKSAGSMSRSRLAGLRVNLPGDQLVEAQRQLRVALPPEATHQQTVAAAAAAAALATASSSHDQCPCSKCQSLYAAYDVDTTPSCSSNNDDLMFSLDSTTAIQGVMTDGLLCSVM